MHLNNCVKSIRIWSYSGPYFSAFGLITEKYGVSLHMQSKCEKIRTRITPNTDTFHAVDRKGCSAQLALLSFMENWKKALENKGFCGAVLTDLPKTSNSINHDFFIKKLHEYRAISNFLLLVT